MKKIKLTQNKIALVDNHMFDLISQYKWQAHNKRNRLYAVRNFMKNKKRTHVLMHRFIMQYSLNRQLLSKEQIDHISGDTLDNRLCNLRVCTAQQNLQNSKPHKNCSSKFKGVSWFKRDKKWRCRIHVNDKEKHLGLFESEKEAALAYNEAALRYFGNFAKLNDIS